MDYGALWDLTGRIVRRRHRVARGAAYGLLSVCTALPALAQAQSGTFQTAEGLFTLRAGGLGGPVAVVALAGALAGALGIAGLFLLRRDRRLRAAQAATEAALLRRIRDRNALHDVFVATDSMRRPMPEVLADLAAALRLGAEHPETVRIRIALDGHLLDEIGTSAIRSRLEVPILIEGRERGRITLARRDTATPAADLPPGDATTLALAASRIAGRVLGATMIEAVAASERRFRAVFEDSGLASLVVVEGRVVQANQAAATMLGHPRPEDLLGRHFLEFSAEIQPDGRPSVDKVSQIGQALASEGRHQVQWEHLHRDGHRVLCDMVMTRINQDGQQATFVVLTDISQRRQAEEALAVYQRNLEATVAQRTEALSRLYAQVNTVFRTAGSGIALVAEGRVKQANPAMERLFLFPPGTAPGAEVAAFFPGGIDAYDADHPTMRALSAGETYVGEVTLQRLDGSRFPARIRSTALDPADLWNGVVWVVDDISGEVAARAEIAAARELAEQTLRLKSEFLAQMSHEIRSPVNAMLGFTELLLSSGLNTLQRDYLQKVQTSGQNLLMIINDILDLSKVEAGKMRMEQTPFDLAELMASATDAIATGAAEKDIELVIEIAPDLPAQVIGDPLRIGQVVINYLSNALKFTERGQIVLSLTREPAADRDAEADSGGDIEDGGGRIGLCFTVEDSGIGLTPDQQARLFESFAQAEESTSRRYGGTGLGLSICRRLTELMEGSVSVDSTPGRGSRFRFVVPLRPVLPQGRDRPRPDLSGCRVLLIEANARAGQHLCDWLHLSGAEVLWLRHGDGAAGAIRDAGAEGRPFVALLLGSDGAGSPVDSGAGGAAAAENPVPALRVLCALRATLEPATVPPVVVMTRRGGQAVVDAVREAGGRELLVKPVLGWLLLDRLAQMLRAVDPPSRLAEARFGGGRIGAGRIGGGRIGGAAPSEITPDPPTAASAGASPPTQDAEGPLTGRQVLVVDDNALNREILVAMLEKTGVSVVQATNGAEALEAILARDFDAVLMDSQMPVMDGLEACRRIRALPTAKAAVPIIGLSGNVADADRAVGLAAGMTDYLAKPVTGARLRATLVEWIDRD